MTTGCGSSDRWRQCEDATAFGGAIRDMWDPTCDGDPGKVSDSQYIRTTGDSGGVHSNSGVPNHLFALLADGGVSNSQTVTPLGFTKAVHILFRAQSVYHSQISDFAAHADAVEAWCSDLIGFELEGLSMTGTPEGPSGEIISAADCQEVVQAVAAFIFNPYNDLLNSVGSRNDNPFAGAETFTGADGGSVAGSWGQSQLDLSFRE